VVAAVTAALAVPVVLVATVAAAVAVNHPPRAHVAAMGVTEETVVTVDAVPMAVTSSCCTRTSSTAISTVCPNWVPAVPAVLAVLPDKVARVDAKAAVVFEPSKAAPARPEIRVRQALQVHPGK